jgi:hypothetical protein
LPLVLLTWFSILFLPPCCIQIRWEDRFRNNRFRKRATVCVDGINFKIHERLPFSKEKQRWNKCKSIL